MVKELFDKTFISRFYLQNISTESLLNTFIERNHHSLRASVYIAIALSEVSMACVNIVM